MAARLVAAQDQRPGAAVGELRDQRDLAGPVHERDWIDELDRMTAMVGVDSRRLA